MPWYKDSIEINYANDLTETVGLLNSMVEAVEQEDPWVKETFNVAGIGEGLVFYPILQGSLTNDQFSTLGFKAKGDKHRTVASHKAVQVKPEVAESAVSFAQLVVTEGRLEQGVSEVCAGEYNMKRTAALLKWVDEDVRKECQAELESSGLTWKQVAKPVGNVVRDWYRLRAT